MQVLFMDAHVLVTRLLLISLYPWMLSLTPPASHSWHGICSGGVSASGGALGLFRLDVCMCQRGGNFWEMWSNKGENCLTFERIKNLLCTGLWECIHVVRVARVRGKCISGGVSALFWLLVSSFSLCFQHDCVERYLYLWRVMFSTLIDCVELLPLS